jgi:aspartate aminotransferase-like enzyme
VSYPSGRHFLQIPGPTNVPDRILRAIAAPTIDHRGPAFQALALEVLEQLRPVVGTNGPVVVYPGSGTGAWEAVRTWGLEVVCLDNGGHSPSVTAVLLPDEHNADKVRDIILDRFEMSLGAGLGKLAESTFRIGHLGHINDLILAGTLVGVQMGLQLAGVPIDPSGVNAALDVLRA